MTGHDVYMICTMTWQGGVMTWHSHTDIQYPVMVPDVRLVSRDCQHRIPLPPLRVEHDHTHNIVHRPSSIVHHPSSIISQGMTTTHTSSHSHSSYSPPSPLHHPAPNPSHTHAPADTVKTHTSLSFLDHATLYYVLPTTPSRPLHGTCSVV
jgi:hypothetical protein